MSDELTLDELLQDYCHDVGASEPEPPSWVVEGCIPAGLTFLIGPPKTLKSTILMMWATATAGHQHTGLPPDMMKVPEPGRVFGLSGEMSAGELRYMAKAGFGCDIPDDRSVLVTDDPWKWRLDEDTAQRKMLSILNTLKPRLFFVDPLVNFHTQDEKDGGVMIQLLLPLRQWAKANNAACVVAHHTRKQSSDPKAKNLNTSPDDARGSGVLFGMADGLIMLTRKAKGSLRAEGIYKRGAPWERVLDVSVWGEGGPKEVTLDPRAELAYRLIKKEGKTWAQAREMLSVGMGTLQQLMRAAETAIASSPALMARLSNTPATATEAAPPWKVDTDAEPVEG